MATRDLLKPFVIENALSAASLSLASLRTEGGLAVRKNVIVGESIRSLGDILTDGSVLVRGRLESTSELTGSLVVDGGFGLSGSLNMTGTLSVKRASHLGDLSVYGRTVFTRQEAVGSSTLPEEASLIVKGTSSFYSKMYMGADLSCVGSATIGGSLDIGGPFKASGSAQLGSNVTVLGSISSDGNLSTKGLLTSVEAVVLGPLTAHGPVRLATAVGITGPLTVDQSAYISGQLVLPRGSIQFGTGISLEDYDGNLNVSSPRPSLRLFSSRPQSASVSLELFSLGRQFADVNHECLQLATKDRDAYVITARRGGLGASRSLQFQTQGNAGQLTLAPDGTVALGSKVKGGYGVNLVGGFQSTGSSHVQGDLVVSGRVYSADSLSNERPMATCSVDEGSRDFTIERQLATRDANGVTQIFLLLKRIAGSLATLCTLSLSGLPKWISEHDVLLVSPLGELLCQVGTNRVDIKLDGDKTSYTLHLVMKTV